MVRSIRPSAAGGARVGCEPAGSMRRGAAVRGALLCHIARVLPGVPRRTGLLAGHSWKPLCRLHEARVQEESGQWRRRVQIVGGQALCPSPEHPVEPGRDDGHPARLLGLWRTHVWLAVFISLPGALYTDRRPPIATTDVARLKCGGLTPAASGLCESASEVLGILAHALMNPDVLLPFEEDHLLLVLSAVKPREPGVRARVCRTGGRFGIHSGLEDGVEQAADRSASWRKARASRPGAEVLDQPAAAYPARRPLLTMRVHEIREAVCGLGFFEDLGLLLGTASAARPPYDGEAGHSIAFHPFFDVRHARHRTTGMC